jgi:hypothetical protein
MAIIPISLSVAPCARPWLPVLDALDGSVVFHWLPTARPQPHDVVLLPQSTSLDGRARRRPSASDGGLLLVPVGTGPLHPRRRHPSPLRRLSNAVVL